MLNFKNSVASVPETFAVISSAPAVYCQTPMGLAGRRD